MNEINSIPVLSVPFRWKGKKLTPESTILSLGSCFSENLPGLLAGGGARVLSNPNGILYNPVSIMESLERIVENIPYTEKDFFFHNGLYCSFSHHGSFSCRDRNEAIEKAEKARRDFAELLPEAELCLITLSTAVIHTHKESGRIVANCHKLPNGEFSPGVLSYQNCTSAVQKILALIRKAAPATTVLFSLSPVRHNPGDPVKESYSKSLLRCAIEEVLPEERNVFYFPAYEILRDELRSYRFYKEDMLHPSELAVKIILSRFRKEFCDKALEEGIRLFEKKEKYICHIPKRKDEL